jgi:hypothetical protein
LILFLRKSSGAVGLRRQPTPTMTNTEYTSLKSFYVAFDSNRVLRKVGKNHPGAVKIYGADFSKAKMKFMLAR